MISFRIATVATLLFVTGCRDWKSSRPSWPDRSLVGLRTLGLKRSVVYPYSVIGGGVETKADVQEAADRDPDVARHYEEVNIPGLEPVTLKSDTAAYVSYRKGGQIYWTSRPVHLAKGERILSDGRNCVRGRCGNRISWQPRTPVLAKEFREPDSAQLNTPEVRGRSIDELPVAAVFSPPLQSVELPVSVANVIAATALPLPSAPALIGGVESGSDSGGAGGLGGGGISGGGPGASGVIGSSNFVPAVLYALTGTVPAQIVIYPGTPSVVNPGVQPSYPIALNVPPAIWTTSIIRVETIASTSVHPTLTPNYPNSPSPAYPTPPDQKPNSPQPPSSPGAPPDSPALPQPPSSPFKPQGDTPSDTSVPEPGTLGLMALTIGGLLLGRSALRGHKNVCTRTSRATTD